MEFAVKHDDGLAGEGLGEAEIVLIGVSRTGKTPLSMFLGYLGYKTANVPLVRGIEPPQALFRIERAKIVGLTIDPERLARIRGRRLRAIGARGRDGYAELNKIYEELEEAAAVQRRLGMPGDRRDQPRRRGGRPPRHRPGRGAGDAGHEAPRTSSWRSGAARAARRLRRRRGRRHGRGRRHRHDPARCHRDRRRAARPRRRPRPSRRRPSRSPPRPTAPRRPSTPPTPPARAPARARTPRPPRAPRSRCTSCANEKVSPVRRLVDGEAARARRAGGAGGRPDRRRRRPHQRDPRGHRAARRGDRRRRAAHGRPLGRLRRRWRLAVHADARGAGGPHRVPVPDGRPAWPSA